MSEHDYSQLPDEEALALAQEVAITRHPEAAPFKDLLSGPNLQAIESLAEDIAKRVKAGQQLPADEGADHHQGDEHQGQATTAADAIASMRANPNDGGRAMGDYLAEKYREALAG